jgi:uncharacterized protein
MAEINEFAPGTFCWVDGGTSDLAKAKAFYSTVFGWEYAVADDSGYTMCLKGGKPVAGLYALDADMMQMGVPPFWLPYVAVADADSTLAKAEAAGAKPMGPVFEAPGHGRGAAFTDPTGAMCGIWQGTGHKGASLAGEHAAMTWMELQTGDPAAAGAFYSSLFGWAVDTMPMPGGEYHLLKAGEEQRGGMMGLTADMAGVPSNWAVYFQVDDADAFVAAAGAADGQVVVPVTGIEGVGRFAVVRSADGAHFSILEPAPMV